MNAETTNEQTCVECGNRAEFHVDNHGCGEAVACGRCIAKNRDEFNDKVARNGKTNCFVCWAPFTRFGDFTKVVTL
ncbi:hypothetical protein [Nocardia sp. NPDC049707]|uniref:hypothetical protein n=1 Tax=Nocardia sp. NPDC049707 TaxID=3154735 RepID=UPI003428E2AE